MSLQCGVYALDGNGVLSLRDVPTIEKFHPTDDQQKFQAVLILGISGLIQFLEKCLEQFFQDSYNDLLCNLFYERKHTSLQWQEAEDMVRRHQITGGLDRETLEEMFLAHMDNLKRRFE